MSADVVQLHIGGQWRSAAAGATTTVTSPATGDALWLVADAGPGDVDAAVASADGARAALRAASQATRAAWCRRVADALEARADAVATDLTDETGRPHATAVDEVAKAVSGLRLAAEEGIRLAGSVIPVADPTKTVFTRWCPTGVWAVLSPWNFPLNIPVEYIGPAIAAGNPVVWKPAPTTVRCAAHLVSCCVEAGLPDGAVNLVTTGSTATAEHLVAHPGVVGIGLTGSTATGSAVARAGAGKRLILELGGNGPIVVLSDADLDEAAAAVAASCFTAAGQICSAGGRVLTGTRHAGDLAEAIAAASDAFTVGDPHDAVELGPVHTPALAERITQQVDDAVRTGARVLRGGRPLRDRPTPQFIPPTVVADVPTAARLNTEETFGPVAPIVALEDDEALIAEANARTHGLSASVFTRDIDRALDAADRIDAGSVVINDRSTYWELHLPFGGWAGKGSGQGRVGVPEVLRQMSQLKTTAIARRRGPQ